MLATIQKVISVVVLVLGAIGATTNVDVSHVAPIISKISTLLGSLSSLKTPTDVDSALLDLTSALSALKATGIITNTTPIDAALTEIAKFTAVEHDYVSGQVALIDSNFSFDGIKGDLFAISKSSPVRADLGM